MNYLLIQIQALEEENEKLKIENEQLKKFKDYFLGLYGEGLEVANWHLNGDLEDFDNFYESAVESMD